MSIRGPGSGTRESLLASDYLGAKMGDSVALMRAASNTAKLADTVKNMWEERTKLRADANGQAWDLILRAQVDEVFLVLAHLGEAILPLGVFNKDYYLQTLGDVKASLASCGNDMLVMAWEELDAELQYTCCAGFTFCAHFSPLPVYRGFGACVLSDWDWGCPDLAYMEEKARKKAIRTVYGVKQKTDPQPTRTVFQDFDQVMQILQVKPMAFFVKRPALSGFTEQPRFGARPKKEVRNDLDLLEDWMHQIIRRGHPSPAGHQISSWGFPYATWTSESNYYILKGEKDCETVMFNQMDPGRLLHAFVCRRAANLDEHSMFLLLPRSPVESIVSWLEGLPGMTHRVIKWENLETEAFEKKIGKSLRKKIGQYPIPIKYAVKNPNASNRPDLHVSESSPALLEHPNTVSPPPYSPTNAPNATDRAPSPAPRERAATEPIAELAGPETMELPATPVDQPTKPPESALKERSATPGLKSMKDLRRRPSDLTQATVASTTAIATATTRHPTVLRPGAMKGRKSTNWMLEDGTAKVEESTSETTEPNTKVDEPTVAELPAETGGTSVTAVPARKPVPTVSVPVPTVTVQPPTDVAELPVAAHEKTSPEPKPEPPTVDPAVPKDTPSAQSSSPPPADAAGMNHLELLNKVASGEITPQALAEMLQNGSIGPPTTTSQPEKASTTPLVMPDAPKLDTSQPETTAVKTPSTLPYPESPSDEKKP